MQSRALIMLIFAVIIGGVAAYLVSNQLQQKSDQVIVEKVETRPVVVAARDLEIGATLDQVMLTTVEWPVAGVPEGAYQDVESAVGKDKPRVILREIRKGEVVLPYKLSVEGARGGLTPRIPENMRAMTISIDEIRGVAGFVLPGDKVDLPICRPAAYHVHRRRQGPDHAHADAEHAGARHCPGDQPEEERAHGSAFGHFVGNPPSGAVADPGPAGRYHLHGVAQ